MTSGAIAKPVNSNSDSVRRSSRQEIMATSSAKQISFAEKKSDGLEAVFKAQAKKIQYQENKVAEHYIRFDKLEKEITGIHAVLSESEEEAIQIAEYCRVLKEGIETCQNNMIEAPKTELKKITNKKATEVTPSKRRHHIRIHMKMLSQMARNTTTIGRWLNPPGPSHSTGYPDTGQNTTTQRTW